MTNLQIALVRYREKNNLNQTELAEMIGCTRNALANWETGRTTPKADVYKIIAEKLNCDISYLLGNASQPTPTPSSPKDQLQGIKLALYDQVEDLTDDQAQQVLDIIKIIKKEN